jgi:hypothetical protein
MFGALTIACGSSDGGTDASNNNTSGAGASTSAGNTTGAGATSVAGCNLNTGYPGDELCIAPPDPSEGFQLHYGPPSYDAAEVEPFLLDPGDETTDCFFAKTPNTEKVFTFEYHGRMRPGSHHLIVYAQDTSVADGLDANCNQGADARFFVGSQTLTVDIPLPGAMTAPENVGLAMELGPNTQMALQLHYINTTQERVLREAWVNMMYSDPATVTQIAEPIFFLGGLAMNIAPNTEKIVKGSASAPQELRILGITGHYHAHTVRFSAWHVVGTQRTLILEDYDWHEPHNLQFDSVNQNPLPDPATKQPGGWSGILTVKPGERIDWECHVINDGNVTLTFANEVYTAEMCNLFGFYTPSMGQAWRAFNF